MELSLVSKDGKKSGKISVSDNIFSVPENEPVVHSALVWYLASRRRGTHSSLTKGEVAGSGVKPWRQKGTGRARVGTAQSPLWRGGGVIFGPKPRKYSYNLPKKVRKLALKVAISDKVRNKKVKLVEKIQLENPKTKEMIAFLNGIGAEGKSLVIAGSVDRNLELSSRNISGVKVSAAPEINIHDLLGAEWLVLDKSAVDKLQEVLK